MKGKFVAGLVVVVVMLALAGCGGGSEPAPAVVVQIPSAAAFDGDIERDQNGTVTISQGNTESVFAGVDPASGAEFRAFLDFPLTGPDGIPGDAAIDSAILDLVINDIRPQPLAGTIPIRVDLVSFQHAILLTDDFDRTLQPALATTTIFPPIAQADFGQHVPVDVTALMVEAQRLGLASFRVRIELDATATSAGLVEINDTTGPNRGLLAPLLQVTYF